MGPEFTEIVATALSDRWIDRADNVGKSTGAFCADACDAHPILTTWADKASPCSRWRTSWATLCRR